MKRLFALPILLVYLFVAASPTIAQTGTVSATVRPNPLKVEITVPANIIVGQWFEVSAEVSNLGSETVRSTKATINTPSGVKVRGKRKGLGNLRPGETKIASWQVKVSDSGNFIIQVEATGKLLGEDISASGSTTISTAGSLGFFLFRLIFGASYV